MPVCGVPKPPGPRYRLQVQTPRVYDVASNQGTNRPHKCFLALGRMANHSSESRLRINHYAQSVTRCDCWPTGKRPSYRHYGKHFISEMVRQKCPVEKSLQKQGCIRRRSDQESVIDPTGS